ncbi:hypothetical protein AALO_G00142500 [Alosa alosa]|uniref:Uncharacterized protein n=1 Tax=Alosa alosa TaxID=278164 RepID=A0AAV6GIE5_9TELE|nr:hypothetical protein AALO_G00142500 [Alosa alosa]
MAMRQLNLLGSLLIILQFSINTSARLKKLEYDSQNPFNLSEGLSVCAMESMFPLLLPWPHSMKVLSIQAEVCLCSTKSSMSMYELCLQVQLELSITNDSFPGSDDDGGGDDDEDDGEYPEEEISTAGEKEVEPQTSIATSEEPASLNLCYTIAQGLPRCYKVACAVHSSRKHPRQTEWFGVLLKPKGLTAGSIVRVTADSIRKVTTTVTVPTIATTTDCTESKLKDCVDPPKLSTEVDLRKGEVHIKVEGKTDKVNICVKSERAGICKVRPFFFLTTLTISCWGYRGELCSPLDMLCISQQPFPRPIPLHSVTPCMCFQAWWNKMGKRSENCLFRKNWLRTSTKCYVRMFWLTSRHPWCSAEPTAACWL